MPSSLLFSFDVGHSSIGWAVLEQTKEPALLGCGTVLFPADDCLASQRRQLRRQRRHIRSTRQRIARLKTVIAHMGVLTQEQLDKPGGNWPWKLAARALAGGKLRTWSEVWDVLRWYAHNRGYDGNAQWARGEEPNDDDTVKAKAALALMEKHGTHSMAATICAKLGVDPKSDDRVTPSAAYKTANAAFPRSIVVAEVRELLEKHRGYLPGITDDFIHALIAPGTQAETKAWKKANCPTLELPQRYRGGLLFGQIIPRFDNRIIGLCPKSGLKKPLKNCVEFYDFRWAEVLANITVKRGSQGSSELTASERAVLTVDARQSGAFTKAVFIKRVHALTGATVSNLEAMLTHPDAEKALVLDPALALTQRSEKLKDWWPTLQPAVQKRALGRWRKDRPMSLAWFLSQPEVPSDVEPALRALHAAAVKKAKKDPPSWESWLRVPLAPDFPSGRAPYAREVMKTVYDDVMAGNHPRREGGPLFMTEQEKEKEREREIDDLTNNHLVRHRLKILLRLVDDLVKTYAGDDPKRVRQAVIEVNRDLVQFSGKTNKEVAQELGLRLKNFKDVSADLLEKIEGTNIKLSAGLIRKARVADDLGWKCPYTGQDYDVLTLARRGVDKDHIIPRSQRASDSLDSLVITFPEVNKWKDNRTARQFIEEEQGKTVPGQPDLQILSLSNYLKFVAKLADETKPNPRVSSTKGHYDDRLRQWLRRQKLELRDYEEKDFTPKDLTVTSQLVRLSARQLEKRFPHLADHNAIISIPGSVTGEVRKAWKASGCLIPAAPDVAQPDGTPKPKGEIRSITHLHHALDAIVLAFTAHLLPRQGKLWEQLVTRKVRAADRTEFDRLHARHALLKLKSPDKNGTAEIYLDDLPDAYKKQITTRLLERRVVQHVPADMSGARLQLNVWRVVGTQNERVKLKQRSFGPKDVDPQTGARQRTVKWSDERSTKLVGLKKGKLAAIKGALVIEDNYGIAIDPEPTLIPFFRVKEQLELLKSRNAGNNIRILRSGHLIRVHTGKYAGLWSVKGCALNNKMGLVLEIAWPDVVNSRKTGVQWAKQNVILKTLLTAGMTIVDRKSGGLLSGVE